MNPRQGRRKGRSGFLGRGVAGRNGFFAVSPHIVPMARTHPHAEASYRVVALADGSFGVEVKIPDSYPTTVSSFATEAEAEAWIVKHKSRVEADSATNVWFRRQGPRGNPSARH